MKNGFERIIKSNAAILYKLCRVYANDNSEYEEIFQEKMILIGKSLDDFRVVVKAKIFMLMLFF